MDDGEVSVSAIDGGTNNNNTNNTILINEQQLTNKNDQFSHKSKRENKRIKIKNNIYIRTGAIIDPAAFIPLALINSPPLVVPFQQIVIKLLTSSVKPSLILAAINASIVAITYYDDNERMNQVIDNSECTTPSSYKKSIDVLSPQEVEQMPNSSIVRRISLCYPKNNQVDQTSSNMIAVNDDLDMNDDDGSIKNMNHSDSYDNDDDNDNESLEEVNIMNNADVSKYVDKCNDTDTDTLPINRDEGTYDDEIKNSNDKNVITNHDTSEDIVFDINYIENTDNTMPLPKCIGMGIVRAIDVSNNCLYMITPVPIGRLNEISLKHGKIVLIRGMISIPPCMMSSSSSMIQSPYMSSEVTGEGSSIMKARTNVKRKYHNTNKD